MTTTNNNAISSEQLEAFLRDGYLVVKNVFDKAELQRVVEKSRELGADQPGTYFSTIIKGAMFSHEAFRSIVLHSKMPKIAAELMQLDPQTQNLRILRYVCQDILF